MKTNDLNNNLERETAVSWMAKNPVTSNLLMLVLIIGGLLVSFRIKQEVFPEFSLDAVNISVAYPGASPEEIEKGILLPIEEAVQGVEGVKEITSVANEGFGSVTVEMITGGDLSQMSDDIQNEINGIRSFPVDAEDPNVTVLNRKRDVITLALYGDEDPKVLYEVAERFRDELLQNKDVTLIELTGVPGKEISIEVSEENLRKYNLTLLEIANRIQKASIEIPGGAVKAKKGEILIRVTDRRDFGNEFEKIPIISSSLGAELLLGDIATVKDSFEETDFVSLYNGKPSITINIYRIGNQTPISVAKATKDYIDIFEQKLPKGIKISILNDWSKIYEQRIDLLLRNGTFGLILVVILLALFLDLKLAFWVAMGIPISFMGAFLFLPVYDISINMMSLFAFIIALGIVVDDAIVVGEDIYSHFQKGEDHLNASISATKDVFIPVTFSVLTNIAAFLPLYFVPGVMGKIFKNIPVVVISVFTLSLIESIFILPSHLAHDGYINRFIAFINIFHEKQQKFSIWFKKHIAKVYGRALLKILYYRYIYIALGIMILLLTIGFIRSGRIGMTTFMKVEADFAKVTLTMPYGTSLENTEKSVRHIIKAAEQIIQNNGGDKLSIGIASNIGVGSEQGIGSNVADIRVYLTDPEIRPLSTEKFTDLWREKTGQIPGIEKILFESDAGGPGSGVALSVELSHRNTAILDKACLELSEYLKEYPNVTDIDSGYSKGKEQFDFKIKPEGLAFGITSLDIARQLRNAFYGSEVVRQLRGRNEVKIMVRLPKSQRIHEYNIEEFLIKTNKGTDIPLHEIAEIIKGRAFTSIRRKDLKRIQEVSCDVKPRSQAGLMQKTLTEEYLPILTRKYSGLTYNFSGKQADIQESVQALGYGMIFALFAIYALLAIPFKSYSQPIIIMVSIPFGIIGAVIGHVIMGYPLSILSMFGIVALSGVVVNDALVLIELANRMHDKGMTRRNSVIYSGVNRFRPIMLTTLTTFGGLAPMIFETSRQAKFLIPMALSLGFGILFSTLITLIIVPCLYLMIEDIKKLFGKIYS